MWKPLIFWTTMQANLNMIEDNFCRESVMLLRQFDDPLRKNNDRDVIKDDTLSYPIIPKHRKLMVLFTRNLMCVCVCVLWLQITSRTCLRLPACRVSMLFRGVVTCITKTLISHQPIPVIQQEVCTAYLHSVELRTRCSCSFVVYTSC